MQFRPSPETVELAIKSQRWYGWLLDSRIDGESRIKIGIDKLSARRNITLRLARFFICISEMLSRKGCGEICILDFGVLKPEFRSPIRDKILKALRLPRNKTSQDFVNHLAEELVKWVQEGHRPDLFKMDKPNLLVLARSK